MRSPHEEISASIDQYETHAQSERHLALGNFTVGSALTGFAAYLGSKGYDYYLGVVGFLSVLNFSVGGLALTRAFQASHQAAALRGALVQYELAGDATESQDELAGDAIEAQDTPN